jgi:hypothetical protein
MTCTDEDATRKPIASYVNLKSNDFIKTDNPGGCLLAVSQKGLAPGPWQAQVLAGHRLVWPQVHDRHRSWQGTD